jgi:branched-chain amino acid transport system permease protein
MLKDVVYGLFAGATYGMLAVGLVLVYKGTRVFNFAQGEFGTLGAFFVFWLFDQVHLPYGVAAILAVALVVVVGLVMERIVIRPLLTAPRVTVLVATVGAALVMISLEIIIGKAVPRTLAPALVTKNLIEIFGVAISYQQLLLVGVLLAIGVGLVVFFRTDRGLAILATSQDSYATRVVGISVPATSRLIWGSAAFLGGLAGILQAPVVGVFGPAFMTALPGAALIPAFTAAVIGGMDSLVGAFVGGEIVGLAQGLGFHFLGLNHGVPGAQDLTVFVALLIVLLARPQGLFGKEVA